MALLIIALASQFGRNTYNDHFPQSGCLVVLALNRFVTWDRALSFPRLNIRCTFSSRLHSLFTLVSSVLYNLQANVYLILFFFLPSIFSFFHIISSLLSDIHLCLVCNHAVSNLLTTIFLLSSPCNMASACFFRKGEFDIVDLRRPEGYLQRGKLCKCTRGFLS